MLTYREYQLEIASRGVEILRDRKMLYLAMEVRTGKTHTSLLIAEQYQCHSVLFVTKLKAISSIVEDYHQMNHTFNIEVINYESLHKLEDISEYDFIILDEAHCLGAFPQPSERTKELQHIVRDKPVVFLSGTPTPESWSQIYHQFWVSQNSPFPHANFYKWAKEFVNVKQKFIYNRQHNDYSSARESDIRAKCDHLFISYTQEQAGFNQVITEDILPVAMKPSTYHFAKKLIADRVVTGKDGNTIMADTAAKMLGKLHQIYSGTVITDDDDRKAIAFDDSKVKKIKEHFAGKKIAIFYKFVAERAMIVANFSGRIVDTPGAFNAGGTDAVYISQIRSGREGINLSTADYLVMLNIDFSAVSYWQARARMQSKDRKTSAKVVWVFAEDGIEQKIYSRVLAKKDYTLSHFKKDFGIRYTDGKG
jgi:hypothetical protein